jgi:hypothetical protein
LFWNFNSSYHLDLEEKNKFLLSFSLSFSITLFFLLLLSLRDFLRKQNKINKKGRNYTLETICKKKKKTFLLNIYFS